MKLNQTSLTVNHSSPSYVKLLTAVHNETRTVMLEVGMSYEDTLDLVLNGIKDNLTTFNSKDYTYDCTSDDVNDKCHKDHY
jgi:hypothetical protein